MSASSGHASKKRRVAAAENSASREPKTDAFGNDIPWDDEDTGGVEVDVDMSDLPESATALFLMASEELNSAGQGGDASEDEAVAQKLLEIALERFEKEQAAGASTAEFLYHYASCLVTVGAHVLVVDMIEQAIALFKQAETAKPTAEDAKEDIPSVTSADILGATALAFVEKARVAYIMDDDNVEEEEDEEDGVKAGSKDAAAAKEDAETIVVASLGKAAEYHERCLAGIVAADDKGEKQLSFSRALLEFANSDFDDDAHALHMRPLDMAVAASEAAMQLQSDDRPSKAQFAACLMCKADVQRDSGDDKGELAALKQATGVLRSALGNADVEDEAETLQLLGRGLIRLAQHASESDDAAEAHMEEAVERYKKALELVPGNPKLIQLLKMMGADDE